MSKSKLAGSISGLAGNFSTLDCIKNQQGSLSVRVIVICSDQSHYVRTLNQVLFTPQHHLSLYRTEFSFFNFLTFLYFCNSDCLRCFRPLRTACMKKLKFRMETNPIKRFTSNLRIAFISLPTFTTFNLIHVDSL